MSDEGELGLELGIEREDEEEDGEELLPLIKIGWSFVSLANFALMRGGGLRGDLLCGFELIGSK